MIINSTQGVVLVSVLKDSLNDDIPDDLFSIDTKTRLALYNQIMEQQSALIGNDFLKGPNRA